MQSDAETEPHPMPDSPYLSCDHRMREVWPWRGQWAQFLATQHADLLHGVMTPTTPTGCLIITRRWVACVAGITSPYARFASSANHSINEAPYWISARACGVHSISPQA